MSTPTDDTVPINIQMNSRMYPDTYPKVDDVVMVKVNKIDDIGVHVSLLEYNNIEGLIILDEVSRKRIKSIHKLIRVGRNEVAVVLRVGKESGYIDLSKKRASQDDIKKCEEKYNKSKSVDSIMKHLSQTYNLTLEYVYSNIAWPLYEKYGHAYDAFRLWMHNQHLVFDDLQIEDTVKDGLMTIIKHRMALKPIKIRSDIEVTCYSYEGVDAIKQALTIGKDLGSDKCPITIKLVTPPVYVLYVTTLDREAGIHLLTQCIDVIRDTIIGLGGSLTVKTSPRAVTDNDDQEITALIDEMQLEIEETSEY